MRQRTLFGIGPVTRDAVPPHVPPHGTRGEFLARCLDELADVTTRHVAVMSDEVAKRARLCDTPPSPSVVSPRERALISARIFALTRLHHLDHVEIGALLGCPVTLIYEWEMGSAVPTGHEACQLAALEEVVTNQYRAYAAKQREDLAPKDERLSSPIR